MNCTEFSKFTDLDKSKNGIVTVSIIYLTTVTLPVIVIEGKLLPLTILKRYQPRCSHFICNASSMNVTIARRGVSLSIIPLLDFVTLQSIQQIG